ncbi:MAG: outer membrane lipoprotein-sorting protein [Balneolia bacterium]|nr:outer membrane lipoprotein-sorting protein [Balneolia bacterium]
MMTSFRNILLFIFPFLVMSFAADLQAQSPETDDERAREIFEKLDERRSAITYETSTLEMRIIDSRERVRNRSMRMYSFDDGTNSKSLTVFESPADVRGTGLLNLNENGSETQLLYLPAVGRIQTVSGSQRNERFLGSDFTFEDLGNQNPDNFEFELLEETDEKITLKATPNEESQYAYIHFIIDAERLVLLQADYFNSSDERIKELTASEYQHIRDDVWRPDLMVMRDLKAERRTELRWNERTFDETIPDRYFTERHLQRGLQ